MTERVAVRPREVCRLLGVSLRTVHSWIRTGKLPAKKVGRVVLVPVEALHQWVMTNSPTKTENKADTQVHKPTAAPD
ncbi:MAG: helix-turn-helix domain-containing protein [Thermoguttaceae bacterium]|nr:helix-turn-helix domain-containing protein [Thermoguttaceae bacterium]